jgi:hypothetical protein|tara:strand:- start:276 stop:584 length:309 start_codon:yes stop_codon:yes gene_type:complete
MFIGSTYQRRDIYNADDLGQNSDEMTHIMDHTNLGYAHIRIKERVLSRTETRQMGDGVAVTSYYYTLICLVDGWDSSAEISEDELQSEIIAGYYNLIDEMVI